MYMYLPYQISVARLRERLEDLGVLDYGKLEYSTLTWVCAEILEMSNLCM